MSRRRTRPARSPTGSIGTATASFRSYPVRARSPFPTLFTLLGQHNVKVTVIDMDGGTSETVEHTIQIDNVAPLVIAGDQTSAHVSEPDSITNHRDRPRPLWISHGHDQLGGRREYTVHGDLRMVLQGL